MILSENTTENAFPYQNVYTELLQHQIGIVVLYPNTIIKWFIKNQRV